MKLPDAQDILPQNTPRAIALFWLEYWFCFFAFVPLILMRQCVVSAINLLTAVWTWNARPDLVNGSVRLVFLSNLKTLLATIIFGERFVAIHHKDVLIDPGPVVVRRCIDRYVRDQGRDAFDAIVATHWHEEHVGNVEFLARRCGCPAYGTRITLDAMNKPERLSLPRRKLMGQPQRAAAGADLRELAQTLHTEHATLEVFRSDGHCRGHASLYDAERKTLFCGDSFMHTIFTAPNRDDCCEHWVRTLRTYACLDIRTMVCGHGQVFSLDPDDRRIPFVTVRQDPNMLIREKLSFTQWAQSVVREAEARGLPYSVIEACVFPWRGAWSSRNWFGDEAARLFSCGEFSRTQLIRSLSATPQNVPPRFGRLWRFASRWFVYTEQSDAE